ncbi:MAG: Gfo/Idh/MocA family oxidoreductase [Planctomycetes bacterium]|nr:Gfo/Idh/MocA family oxidoreductase [Planctomycetota bacterium]
MIRCGVVGAGAIAYSSCEAMQSHGGAEIVAASDLNPDRLKELCDKFSISRSYADSAELFADKDVDAVYIGVPNKFHAPLALAALEAGKHVILDKPFALNAVEAQQVADAAEKAGKIFMLGMNQRYRKESQMVRSLVEKGVLGDIYHAKAFWFRRAGIPKLGTWFGNKALAGGGALLDIGVHLLDLALFCVDEFDPKTVSGSTYTTFGNRGLGEGGWGKSDRAKDFIFDVDDFATAFIRFDSGLSMTLDVSWAAHAEQGNRNDVHLYGSEAGASLYPNKLFRFNEMYEGGYEVIDGVQGDVALPHCDRFHNFLNSIKGEEKPLTSIAQSMAVQKILDGIYESCKQGKEVSIS